MRVFTALILMIICQLDGAVMDHLRTISDREPINRFHNIDYIYLINLDHRTEKLQHCQEQFAPYDIQPHRFSAVYGWTLPLEVIHDVGFKIKKTMSSRQATVFLEENGGEPTEERLANKDHTYFCTGMSKGAIGIILSHLSIVKDAYDSGYETVWILEDDVQVHQHPDLIPILLDKLDALVGKEGWDIFFTDRDSRSPDGGVNESWWYGWRPDCKPADKKKAKLCKKVGDDFLNVGLRYGTYSYILRRSGMKKILDFYTSHEMFNPYDIDIFLAEDFNAFTVIDDIVSNDPDAVTDNAHSTGW